MKNLLLLALIAPAAASAQTVSIARGETVTVTIADDGTVRTAARAPTPLSDYETAVSTEFLRGDYDDAVGAKSVPMTRRGAGLLVPTPKAGRIVLRFVRSPGKDASLLSIQNGYPGALSYRATIRKGDTKISTDVCIVRPGKVGNEFWPYPIDALDLSSLRLVPWQEGDPVKCE